MGLYKRRILKRIIECKKRGDEEWAMLVGEPEQTREAKWKHNRIDDDQYNGSKRKSKKGKGKQREKSAAKGNRLEDLRR